MGVYLATMRIASAGTDSPDFTSYASARVLRTISALSIQAPAALTGTVTVQVPDSIGSSPSYQTLQSGGADVQVTAGDAIPITRVPFHGFRLHSGSAEGANRDFVIMGEEKT